MATTTLPTGWSLLATRPREELHQALLTSTCDRAYCDVPVDWWDEPAGVWRPTSIVRVLGGVWEVGRDVEVLTPGFDGTSPRKVSIADVRLSRLLTAGVSRYWVARYQRTLVLRLIERATLPDGELDALRSLAVRLGHEEALGCDVWATAYHAGAPDDVSYIAEAPPIGNDEGSQVGPAHEVAALIRTAVRILAADLLRIDASLEEGGASAAERAAHPLLRVITSLLLRSPMVRKPVTQAGSDPHLA